MSWGGGISGGSGCPHGPSDGFSIGDRSASGSLAGTGIVIGGRHARRVRSHLGGRQSASSFSYSYTPRCINPDRYRSKAEHSPCKSLDPAGCTSAIKSSRFRRASAARIRARGNVVAGKVRYGGFANPTGNHRFRGLDAAPRQRARSVRVRPQSALLQGRTLLCRDRPSNRRLQPDKDKSARFVPGYLGGATRCVV